MAYKRVGEAKESVPKRAKLAIPDDYVYYGTDYFEESSSESSEDYVSPVRDSSKNKGKDKDVESDEDTCSEMFNRQRIERYRDRPGLVPGAVMALLHKYEQKWHKTTFVSDAHEYCMQAWVAMVLHSAKIDTSVPLQPRKCLCCKKPGLHHELMDNLPETLPEYFYSRLACIASRAAATFLKLACDKDDAQREKIRMKRFELEGYMDRALEAQERGEKPNLSFLLELNNPSSK